MNGMTRAGSYDVTRGVVFDWTSGNDYFYEYEIIPSGRDFTDYRYLSFRACQGTRHPETTAELADLNFTVTLCNSDGVTSSINIGAYGGGIEEPYQRIDCGEGIGWQNEFETIRIRLNDFLHNGVGLNLADIVAVRFEFGSSFGSSRGRIGLDDVELTDWNPSSDTIYVDDDADPSWYDATHVRTIQEGIGNASVGNTVFVYNGIYYENVIVNKTVNIYGEEKESTIIDGGGDGDVVTLNADIVSVWNFTIRNSGPYADRAGIQMYSSENTICNNIITDNKYGVRIYSSSSINQILDNTIGPSVNDGICLFSSSGNVFSGNACRLRISYTNNSSEYISVLHKYPPNIHHI